MLLAAAALVWLIVSVFALTEAAGEAERRPLRGLAGC